jgi:general secretion pathway protein D
LDQLARIVREIDVRQPQVVLELLLINLTEGETLDFGVELAGLIESGRISARVSSLFGLAGVESDGLSDLDVAGSGASGVLLSPGEFSAVVRALETVNEGRSLSMPRLIVGNNQTATLNSVLQQPFTSTNASDTVATTSFGGTQDAGTTVTITPQVGASDNVLLQFGISLSSFVGESSSPSLPPPRTQNSLQSFVAVPDGFVAVVGGIELVSDAEAESRVPLIGGIPLLGELFKNTSESASRSRFYLFVRATIDRSEELATLRRLSRDLREPGWMDDEFPASVPIIVMPELEP